MRTMRFWVASLIVAGLAGSVGIAAGQDQRPTFRATVQRVAVAATVRTKQGKTVTTLTQDDFTLLDSGTPKKIVEFRADESPITVGLLVDFSGSMGVAEKRAAARANAFHLISWLRAGKDEAGLFVFDKGLREAQPIAPAPGDILAQLDRVERPFGATSLFDAIAETGRILSERGGVRRAVVALTDGADNASRLSPAEVSKLASGIDVPVYIVVVVSPLDRAGHTVVNEEQLEAALEGPLAQLARFTGGEIFAGIGPAQSSAAARQITTELRQQYLIAFEPDGQPGWHPIDLRTKDKNLVVRARSGYVVRGVPAGN